MSFTYNPSASPDPITAVRLLVADTVNNPPEQPCIFQDEEIEAFYAIQRAQWQTSQLFTQPMGRNLPLSPLSYLRVAALALDSLAANQSRLASIVQILDVKLNPQTGAKAMRDQADNYRAIDDDAGAFAILEQCTTIWNFQDRFWYQVMRQSGGGIGI